MVYRGVSFFRSMGQVILIIITCVYKLFSNGKSIPIALKFLNKHLFNISNAHNTAYFQFKDALPAQLMDSKLRCVFEIPSSGGDDGGPMKGSGAPQSDTAATASSVGAHEGAPPRTPPKAAATSTTTTSSSKPQSSSASEAELKKASEEIKHLRSEASNLRQENLSMKVGLFLFVCVSPGQSNPTAAKWPGGEHYPYLFSYVFCPFRSFTLFLLLSAQLTAK